MRGVLVLVALLLVGLSPLFGRSAPTGNYRPALPPDALTDGCWPLPGDVRLDFAYQVRTDDVVATSAGPRRVVVLHYDQVSAGEALAAVQAAFAAEGLADDVEISAHDFSDTADLADTAVVHGEMVLDLPPSEPERRPECLDPFSTKQFTTDMPDVS